MSNPGDVRKELENAINNFEANQEAFEMSVNHQAKMMYMMYKAYILAGFTEEQAFDLIIERGLLS